MYINPFQGVFTVTNNHSLIVSQLKAGVINVRDGSETKAGRMAVYMGLLFIPIYE